MPSTQELDLEGKNFSWKLLLAATGWFALPLAVTQALRAGIYRLLPLLGMEQAEGFWDVLSMGTLALHALWNLFAK